MKRWIALLVLLSMLLVSGSAAERTLPDLQVVNPSSSVEWWLEEYPRLEPLTTEWLGWPIVGKEPQEGDLIYFQMVDPPPSGTTQALVPWVFYNKEIGLRSDGVVVWRKAK